MFVEFNVGTIVNENIIEKLDAVLIVGRRVVPLSWGRASLVLLWGK